MLHVCIIQCLYFFLSCLSLSYIFILQSLVSLLQCFVALGQLIGPILLMVPVGAMGRFQPGDSPFQAVRGAYGLCPKTRAFQGLSCLEAFVTFYLWFRFQPQSMIAICSRIYSPEEVKSNFENDLKFLRKKNLHKIVLGHINVTSIRK